MRASVKHGLRLGVGVVLATASVLLSGCCFSEGPFFEDKQIVQDKRIEGNFGNAGGSTNGEVTEWSVSRSKEDKKQYLVQFADGDAKHELTGTLFRLNDTLLLDLFPLKESGVRHVPGGSVTSSEVLHSIMAVKKHFVLRIAFADDGVDYSFPNSIGVMLALKKAGELKIQRMGEMAGLILPSPAKEAQKYLLQFGKDVSVFNSKGHLTKKK